MSLIFKGVFVGFILMLFVGPSFFYLIRVGITYGFRSAAGFALGIIISDLLFLVLIIRGLSDYFDNLLFQQVFSLCAGIMILLIGIYSLVKKINLHIDTLEEKSAKKDIFGYFIKGLLINSLNPFTFMVWLAVIGSVELKWNLNSSEYPIFVGSLLITVFCLDVLKAYGANYLGRIINAKTLSAVNRILGGIFIFLGCRLLYHFYKLLSSGHVNTTFDFISNGIN